MLMLSYPVTGGYSLQGSSLMSGKSRESHPVGHPYFAALPAEVAHLSCSCVANDGGMARSHQVPGPAEAQGSPS